MDKSKEELEQRNYKNTLARYDDDLKTLNTTMWVLSVVLLIMFGSLFYVVPAMLEDKQWYWLIAFAILGALFYKVFTLLQKYKQLIEITMNDFKTAKRLKDIQK